MNKPLALALWCALALLPAGGALAYHFPWDQGHDTTDWGDPNAPGPCEGPNCDPCEKGTGSPVFIATGHYIWSETDVAMTGRPGLSLTRTYNSNDPRAGIFGNGWSSDCDLNLVKTTRRERGDDGELVETEVLQLTAANGKRYEFVRDASGAYVPPSGRSESVERITDEDGETLSVMTSQSGYSHTFDDTGRMTRRAEPNGRGIDYAYDDEDRLSGMSDDAGRSLSLSYDARGLVSGVADHTGRQWGYTYDDDGNLVEVSDPLGGSRTYEYRAYSETSDLQVYHQLVRIVDPSGVTVSDIEYDGARVESYTAGANAFSYRYETSRRRVTKTDRQNSRWIYEYDENQVITRKTDPRGNVETYEYDEDGNLVAYTDALDNRWESTFDDERRKTSDTSPLGFVSRFEYDGDLASPERVISPTGRVTATVYDARGNAISVTNAAGEVADFEYDAGGDLVAMIDALGHRTEMSYNDYGLVAATTDAAGRTTTFAYDELGRVSTLTSGNGETLTTAYDALGRVTSITDPSGKVTAYAHDAAGRTLSMTDPAGSTTSYVHDEHGRVSQRIYPDGRTIDFAYRSDNLPVRIDRPDGEAVTYAYDAAKLVTSIDVGGDATTYAYSARYELLSVRDSDATITFDYDDDGRLVGESFDGTALSYAYNPENERVSFTHSGRTLDYTRDPLGRVTAIGTPEGDYGFAYDGNGSRISTALPNGALASYAYDDARQLVGLRHTGPFEADYGYEYDASGILQRQTGGEGDWTYTYDSDAQLVGAADSAGAPESYAYDDAGNLLGNGRRYDANHRLIESDTWALTYDALGNVTEKARKGGGETVRYTWNAKSELLAVARFDAAADATPRTTTRFTYGPMGRRLSRTVDGTTERYLYDGPDRMATLDASGSVVGHYTFGPGIDEPLGVERGGDSRYFHADHLGSVVALSDDASTTDTYRYDPWGETLARTGASENDFRYTAREYEAEDLYYYRARYYDPTLRRFLSEDPMGFAGGDHNLYRYVGNNPANFTDPSGNWAFLIPIAWAGIEAAMAIYEAYTLYETLSDPCIGTWDKATETGLVLAGFLLPGGGYSKADDAARYADDVADAVRRSPCGCFDADTLVLTENGHVPIADVEVGDLVASRDDKSGEIAYRPVTELLRYEDREFYRLSLTGSTGATTVLDVTDDHPFWVEGFGWVESDQLRSGMRALALDDEWHVVSELIKSERFERAHNIEVADFHTYFVGEENLWVHNCPLGNVDDMLAAGGKADKNGLTKAGRALQKHGDRNGSAFPKSTGNAESRNKQGQNILEGILSSGNQTTKSNRFGGTDVYDNSTGRGVRYDGNGNMMGFLEP